MQLMTIISAATAMVAGVSATTDTKARNAVDLDSSCDKSQAYAKVVNRCSYPVYLWSVYKGNGCPSDGMVTLKNGESYYENLADPDDGVGVSIKISKETTCKPTDIVQLEYFLEKDSTGYEGDYLDVSYVDCTGNDCPTKSEGYYLVAGNQTGAAKASASNTWCPILSCTDAASCALMSYILPDDVQTKTCDLDSNIEFYMCGGDAPDSDSDDDGSSYESVAPSASTALASYAASSSVVKPSTTFKAVVSSASKSSSTKTVAPSSTSTYGDSDDEEAKYEVKAAAVTSVPAVSSQTAGNSHNVKTEVVYVTAYEYTRVKRHSHDHARRHQQFHA